MSERSNFFKNNPIVGWFQYSTPFKKETEMLPKNNSYVGTFTHHLKNNEISKEEYDLPLDKLLLYFRTIHTVPQMRRSVGTQTTPNDTFVIVQ